MSFLTYILVQVSSQNAGMDIKNNGKKYKGVYWENK
jgi:hypothetical protein